MKKARLVKSEKGAAGGYVLSKNPSQITVFEIIKTLEGKMSPFHCIDQDGKIFCDFDCKCGATKVLVKVQNAVNSTLKSIKLSDLI